MAFDAARGEIVMTGGINDGKTWIWNGTDWAERVTVTPAPDLSGGPLAYDPDHQSVLAYAPNTSRTWRWDGADWSNVTPASMPVARFGAVMVADATEHVVSLIGGVAGGVPTGEHWIWDGSQWSPRAGGGATITYSGTAVFDSVRGEVVVAGGYLAGATLSTRTWLLR